MEDFFTNHRISIYSEDEMRNVLPPNSSLKWNTTRDEMGNHVALIPYTIEDSYTCDQRKMITDAMRIIEKNTCVRFRERRCERDYLEIRSDGEGCYAEVGRRRGRSVLNLETSERADCVEMGTIFKELLHSIGLWHEHTRMDRDEYVKLHEENIVEGKNIYFAKIGLPYADTYGMPYDYLSIMHYRQDAFAKPGTVTLETLDTDYQDIIGITKRPSKNDYKKICLLYKCDCCNGKRMRP
ncbi:astacin [Necator americanus]|uniref:Metalloendopeptidase n=1 Tax=Necator americanus TaxID=51031 RepID=W2T6T7_NECAM|nr:astacin [Necator americanus]ETN76866.1 astacin [Necator americanus]